MKNILLVPVLMMLLFSSCKKENQLQPNQVNTPNNSSNLPNGIARKSQLDPSSSRFIKIAKLITNSSNARINTEELTAELYIYETGDEAIVAGFLSEPDIAYVDLNFIEGNAHDKVIKLSYNETDNDNHFSPQEMGILDITNPNNPIVVDRFNGWGKCMANAIDELYNRWETDPLIAAGCMITAWRCAAGAGIACAFQTW